MDAIPGLVGSNGTTGNNGANVINATGDTTTPAATNVSTLTALDNLDGGNDNDTLNISVVGGTFDSTGLGLTVKNIETVNAQGTKAMTLNTTAWTGLNTLNVTKSLLNVTLTSANTTDVSVVQADATVAVTGGKSVTIAKTMDAITDVITVDGAGAVTITATDSNAAAGDITIGGTTAVTGAVAVTSTGAKIVGGTGAVVLDDIFITGGTTVAVTQAATADMGNVATAGALTDVVTQGVVTVTGGAATTSVSVVQGDQVTAKAAAAAIAAVSATKTVTFVAMAANDSVTIDGLTFTASKTLTAAEAAAAFAGLTAPETQGQGFSANGAFTGNTVTAKWTSGPVVGNTVTFSQTVAGAAGLTLAQAIAGVAQVTEVAGVTGVLAQTAVTGVLGVDNGAVTINDNATAATITSVTVDGYSASATIGGTNALNALTTLSLANSGAGTAAVTTNAVTLGLTVNDVTAGVTLTDAALKTLNITTATKDSAFALATVTLVEALNVSGTNALNLGATALTSLKTLTVGGSAGLTVDASGAAMTSVVTTTTGTVTATIDSTKGTYTGGAGKDNVILSNTTATSKAIDLGAGDDSFKLAATGAVPTATVVGGEGTDTVSMTFVSAATTGLSGSAAFAGKVTGFERLTINDNVTADATVDLSMLGFNYVTTSGVAATKGLTLDKMAANGTVVLTAAAPVGAGDGVIVNVTDATLVGNTTDVLNLVATSAGTLQNAGTTLIVGQVTAAGVETINITSTDSKADNDGDGVTDPVNTHALTLSDAAVKTINVTGNANLTLTNTDNVALTLLDASTGFTGVLNASTNGTVAETIKGGSGNDILVATTSNLADTLIGGLGNDSLTTNAGLTILTGGAGVDTFIITAASLNVNSYSTITDASKGDIIKFTGADAFATSKVVLGGTAVFQDYANATTIGASTNDLAWFQTGGDTYIVMDVNASTAGYVNGSDKIVKLTGLIDLSIASFNATNGTIELG